jgi:glutamate-1-semialdehyde 2,1-aminomutase
MMITTRTSESEAIYAGAQRVTPAGVHSNSRARAPHPIYYSRADGPYIWDVDGQRRVDLGMGNGAILLGHNHPAVQDAVAEALAAGMTCGLETESAFRAAELFLQLVPSADQVRFTNTGTEAMLHALQIARAATGRRRIAKTEGAYHGWADSLFVSTWPDLSRAGAEESPNALPGTGGLDPRVVEDTLVLPFNQTQAAERLLRAHANDIAAVVVEPTMIDIGFVPAEPEFLAMLRRVADETGIILLFDELLTGFRLARGGAQEHYGVRADLAIYGKALGNGYPVAAVAGKENVMVWSAPGPGRASFVGTFNGHAVSMAAVRATLQQLADGTATATLQARTEMLIAAFAERAAAYGVPATMRGAGGHIHWYFAPSAPVTYRQAAQSNAARYMAFTRVLAERDFMIFPNYLLHHAISLAHDEVILQQLVEAMDAGLQAAAQVQE